MAFLNAPSCSHLGINLRQSTTPEPLNLSTYCTRSDSSAYRRACPFWSAIWSRTSIETVIHTGDCDDYDVNCVQYRKARYWRELSTPDLEEEIRKVRKVLAKIQLYRATRNPALHPASLGNTRRTLAQLLFIRHERHLASLREKENLKKLHDPSNHSSAAGDEHE